MIVTMYTNKQFFQFPIITIITVGRLPIASTLLSQHTDVADKQDNISQFVKEVFTASDEASHIRNYDTCKFVTVNLNISIKIVFTMVDHKLNLLIGNTVTYYFNKTIGFGEQTLGYLYLTTFIGTGIIRRLKYLTDIVI